MKLNRLDEIIAKSKTTSIVVFAFYVILVCIVAILGVRCCMAVVRYSSTSSFDALFLDQRVNGYYLGRFVFNWFETSAEPFSLIKSFFKSISLIEVMMYYLFVLLIFQDPSYKWMKQIRISAWSIMIIYSIGFSIFGIFLIFAAKQLTAANAFNMIKEGAFYAQYIFIAVIVIAIILLVANFLYITNLNYLEEIEG